MRVTHHLYQLSADLWPACGIAVGPEDDNSGHWHTADEAARLLTHEALDHLCCPRCVRLARHEMSRSRELI